MIESVGECELSDADDANIPVNIFIEEEDGRWKLTADNFMPRKSRASGNAYEVHADTLEELQQVVKDEILPLYQTAVAQLEAIVAGSAMSLYYWERKDDLSDADEGTSQESLHPDE